MSRALIVDPADLRNRWTNDPRVDDYTVHALQQMTDDQITQALIVAQSENDQPLWDLLDRIATRATDLLEWEARS